MSPTGEFLVTWTEAEFSILAQLFSPAGRPVAPAFKVPEDRPIQQQYAGAAAALGIAAALVFAFHHPRPGSNAPKASEASRPTVAATTYEIISDQELLVELKDRPLLVVQKKDGGTEFLLLEY